jgi:altronate hydrolase
MFKQIKINPKDNVAVALTPLKAGTELVIDNQQITLLSDIPQAHKFAITAIAAGTDIIKYGSSIGKATQGIAPGEHVHTHNCTTNLSSTLEYQYNPAATAELPKPKLESFMGYLRSDGQAGIRNEIWILPTVGCTNQTAAIIAQQANAAIAQEAWGDNIDGVYAFTHPFGCSQLGEDHQNTQKILCALAQHPNAAGVLVLGLGCENNQVEQMQKTLGDYDPDRIKFLIAQEVEDEIEVGTEIVLSLAKQASTVQRQELPLSYLKIGLKCGGSDGLSGVTANPLVGWISDYIVSVGGTSVLTEVPEMFGAEHLLMNRAKDQAVFNDIVKLINDFKEYFLSHNQPVYENPSPGNKEGGITTLEDKSLGCTEKGGRSQVVAVRGYGDRVSEPGLNLLCSPGNDIVAVTALAAAGCQVILFTTGRGTPLGTCVPVIKIATNSQLYHKKLHWIDFNAGIITEGVSMEEAADQLFSTVVAAANGTKTKAEQLGFRDIAIWKSGVTL